MEIVLRGFFRFKKLKEKSMSLMTKNLSINFFSRFDKKKIAEEEMEVIENVVDATENLNDEGSVSDNNESSWK